MMTIKEQFISEIKERIALQKDLLKRAEDSARIEGSIDALQGLLNSMDSLESEKPMNQDELEQEIQGKRKELIEVFGPMSGEQVLAIKDLARHFAEWGYLRAAEKYDEIEYNRQRAEESVPNDLEEAAMNYIAPIENEDGLKVINFSGQDIKDAFIAGAKWQENKDQETIKLAEDHAFLAGADWQKEQMMKEAVEAEILLTPYPTIWLDDCKDYDFKDGQKVRIIIVKGD